MGTPGGYDGAPKGEHLQPSTSTSSSTFSSSTTTTGPTWLTIRVLQESTDNFCEERVIALGANGIVYKGMLRNGEEIALKVLYNNTPTINDEQFKDEIGNLMMLNHKNVIRLVGCCHENQYQLTEIQGQQIFSKTTCRVLCFEYMPMGSLQKHLYDETQAFDWKTRYKIIKGICEGLKYLHEGIKEPIYHLDLTPENILLDQNMIPKLAGFGLSERIGEEQSKVIQNHIGPPGYVPPEYFFANIVSKKFDIFSLGAIITKIIAGPKVQTRWNEMGRQKVLNQVLANWRNRLDETSEMLEAICQQVRICTDIGHRCLEFDRHKRPSILEIIHKLDGTETMIEKTRYRELQYLKEITNNFSEERIVGEGGSGVVYRGELHNGKLVAVKKVNTMCKTEELCEKSKCRFETEVALLMRLEHPNIVQALNYCYEMKQKLQGGIFIWQIDTLLCLEYLPQGSLHDHISDATSGLDWRTRYKIIKGISYGLRYLHEQPETPIIHLDLKPANILLDANMVPKIADFGISRLYNEGKTIHTKSNDGTPGYMAPEYILRGLITRDTIKRGIITLMSDIFSLGVIIMEIITGHKDYPFDINEATSQEFIHNELGKWRNMLEKNPSNTNLETYCQQIEKCIQIGLKCVNHDRTKRPTIREITNMLEGLGSTNC